MHGKEKISGWVLAFGTHWKPANDAGTRRRRGDNGEPAQGFKRSDYERGRARRRRGAAQEVPSAGHFRRGGPRFSYKFCGQIDGRKKRDRSDGVEKSEGRPRQLEIMGIMTIARAVGRVRDLVVSAVVSTIRVLTRQRGVIVPPESIIDSGGLQIAVQRRRQPQGKQDKSGDTLQTLHENRRSVRAR